MDILSAEPSAQAIPISAAPSLFEELNDSEIEAAVAAAADPAADPALAISGEIDVEE